MTAPGNLQQGYQATPQVQMLVGEGVPAVQPEDSYPVYLKAYDLSFGLASFAAASVLGVHLDGVWHTAVAVYGKEYLFGDGIQGYDEAHCEKTTPCPLLRKILVGYTQIPQDVFEEFLDNLSENTFTKETYDLLEWNCNNFSNAACEFLIGRGIPSEYVDYVNRIKSTPNGAQLIRGIVGARQQNRQSFPVPGQR